MLPDTSGFCMGDSLKLEIKEPLDKNASIQWTTPANIIYNTKKITVFRTGGKHYVKVVSHQKIITDSTFVKVYQKPQKLLRDTTLCASKSGVVIDAKNAKMSYFWSTGEISQRIKIENSGLYWVKITNKGCSIVDSVKIKLLPAPIMNINGDVQFCLSEETKVITLKAQMGTKILWNNGSNASQLRIYKEGTYWVRSESKQCGITVDSIKVKFKACDCEMIIPNSFTPNEDDKNDYFFPVLQCEYTYYLFTISDKYGNMIFQTNQTNSKWDGRFKGNLCTEDNYVYHIEAIEKQTDKKTVRNGYVSLIR